VAVPPEAAQRTLVCTNIRPRRCAASGFSDADEIPAIIMCRAEVQKIRITVRKYAKLHD